MARWLSTWSANNDVVTSPLRFFHLIAITLFLTTTVLAQSDTLLPTAASATFPACGLTCKLLTEAASSCLASVDSSQSVHVSCFCQSSLLTTLHTSPDGTCDDTCSEEPDRVLLKTWYNNFCNSGGSTTTASLTTTTKSSGTTAAATAAATTAKTTAAAASDVSESSVPKTWWQGHYQWVIMVIVLVVAFTTIALVGAWLKRRHDAKHPNLYHGVGRGSGAESGSGFFNRQQDGASNRDGPSPSNAGLAPPPRFTPSNRESIASSSRSVVLPSKAPSRLQKHPHPGDDKIREV